MARIICTERRDKMAYKLLVYSKTPAVMRDFFLQTRNSFRSLSTTYLREDIMNHLEVFSPDGILIFCEPSDEAIVSQIKSVKGSETYKNLPVFITGEGAVCEAFEKKMPGLVALSMKKPTSAPIMEQQINRYFTSKGIRSEKPADEKNKLNVSLDDLMRDFGDAPAAPKQDPNRRRHILVVDDDRSILKLLKTALSDNYDVTTIVSGNMAMKFLETKTVDLILLDYEMPIENGAEVFRKLKANKRYENIPVVFLTGVADSSRIKEVLMLKPQGYLLKPISMDRLMSSIKNILK